MANWSRDPFQFSNPWHTLGIQPGCSLDELRRAYRVRVKQCHPDQFASNPERLAKAEEEMKEVNEAFKYLKERAEANAGKQAPIEDFNTWRTRTAPSSQPPVYTPRYTPPARPKTKEVPLRPSPPPPKLSLVDMGLTVCAGLAAAGLAYYAGIWFAAVTIAVCWVVTIAGKLQSAVTIFNDAPDALLSFTAGSSLAAGYHWSSGPGLGLGFVLSLLVLVRSAEMNGIPRGVAVGVFKITFALPLLALPRFLSGRA